MMGEQLCADCTIAYQRHLTSHYLLNFIRHTRSLSQIKFRISNP